MPPMIREERPEPSLDLAALRARLASRKGSPCWRSLEDIATPEELEELLRSEFPRQASAWSPALDRRGFLTLLGASLALAGLHGCTIKQPEEKIVPYVQPPEEMTPGKPLFFATAMPQNGYAVGILAASREGRPIKIEGNPDHPASLGATDAIMQASLLTLYDPDRSQAVLHRGRPDTWEAFLAEANAQMQAQQAVQGAGLRILTETVASPTLFGQLEALLARFPRAQWIVHEPTGRTNVAAGAQLAFGTPVESIYHLDKADVVVSFDGDFLLGMPGHVRYARDFAEKRRVRRESTEMNRLYAAECTPTITGAMADHRLPVRPGDMVSLIRALAQQIGVISGDAVVPESASKDWITSAAADLKAHSGAGLVIVGEEQSPEVHALAHAINQRLGNTGAAISYVAPIAPVTASTESSLTTLVRDIQAGQVQMLVILDSNPVYTAPADVAFADALLKVPLSAHLGLYDDETATLCQWHIPQQHYLEAWSDGRAYDGTVTIQQPLIAPLYADSRSTHELLDALLTPPGLSGHSIVKAYWQRWKGRSNAQDFETFWRTSLHDGIVQNSAAAAVMPTLRPDFSVNSTSQPPDVSPDSSALDIVFRPDPTIRDGRFANNGWLQELPKPLSKLTWDNAALLSPRTAETHHLANGDMVELRYRGRMARAPIWILPGQPDNVVTAHLGYGRTRAGSVGTGAGFNAYALRTSDAPWFGDGLEMHKTGEQVSLACTHSHHTMEGRDILRIESIEAFRKNPAFLQSEGKPPMLLPESPRGEYAWGMAIDLNVCIGCNACVTACQAENNIPIVGKTEVQRGREMHWIRIDRYYTGSSLDSPDNFGFMPVPCMHCEKAPCELVCPVGATVHGDGGLNEMVYNRCVGTRYCSNNCPYKVRRFNFLHYTDLKPSRFTSPTLQLMHNPEVTMRSRGVMEKCTYCVQRIQNTKIDAERENRRVGGEEIQTACQQACPTRAIHFGDINDSQSDVSKCKEQPHNYSLLAELNTRPRTTYLAKLHNPSDGREE